jgi:acylpyruvate hydrolase
MKLLTFTAGSAPRAGALINDGIIDLNMACVAMLAAAGDALPYEAAAAKLPADLLKLITLGEPGRSAAKEALAWVAEHRAGTALAGPQGERIRYARDEARLRTPIARPEKILGIGLNYKDHCREMGRELPKEIRTFAMFPNALIGDGEDIILPNNSSEMDYEAELVAVIGKPARHVPADKALGYVAGYTIGNDVSARDHQRNDPQTTRGKTGDTHAPAGPWIVTTDEIPDPGGLDISLRVNGEVRQDSNTSELVFPVPVLVSFLSNYFTLAPGDLIYTGTPAGVAAGRKPPLWLKPGDTIEVRIEKIGALQNRCVAEG